MTGLRLPRGGARPASALTPDRVRAALDEASYAVLSYMNPAGRPRAGGVAYAVAGRRLHVATDPDSCEARSISTGDEVAVTVPIRRGGELTPVAPIPPATVTFHARATVHPAGSVDIGSVAEELVSSLPPDRRNGCLLERVPEGSFVTYGLGVSLRDMAKPDAAQAHVPVGP